MSRKYLIISLNVSFILTFVSVYYLFLYAPSVSIYRAKTENEFLKEMALNGFLMDNAIQKVIEGAKSMSSRSMIRKKIIAYQRGEVSFQELKEYSEPKYLDGLNALDDCTYAARYVKGKLLLIYDDTLFHGIDGILADTLMGQVTARLEIRDTFVLISVVSPIIDEKEGILGYDLIYSRCSRVLKKIRSEKLDMRIFNFGEVKEGLSFQNGVVYYTSNSNATPDIYQFFISEDLLFKDLQGYKIRQALIMILFTVSISLILLLVQQRMRIFYLKHGRYLEDLVDAKTVELKDAINELEYANDNLTKNELLLTESNQTKDKFFSIIAHDLIGPFHSMVGLLKFLREEELSAAKKTQYISMCHDIAQSTHNLLGNLLSWSRSQRGLLEFEPEKIQLKKVVEKTFRLLQQQAGNKSIILSDRTDDEFELIADNNMLSTVLRNLVSNAIKFSHRGGHILVQARKVSESKFAEIEVSDSGVGIDPDDKEKLFKISENISKKGTAEEAGTGLGLILCKEFIEMHGGTIRVESESGKGSTFFFTLPSKQ